MDKATINGFDLKYSEQQMFGTSDGAELYFELRGEGPQLTILNNFFIISPLWRNFTKELVKQNRILTYDFRNQGASSPACSKLRVEDHVNDLRELLDDLGIEKTYLLGTSVSTLIARDFALAFPERVKGLIFVGPVFSPFGSRRRKLLTRSWLNSLEKGGPACLFDHIYPLVYSDRTIEGGGTPAYLALRERFLALVSHEQIKINLQASLTTEDDPAMLRQIACPVMLIAGDGDFLSSSASLCATANLFPRAHVELLDFAGHVPYFEATTAFERAVQNFIQSAEKS
jgi:pimeloyl-ACP methyl ester carboxylesterase